jgi:hypothetical protein
MMLLNDSPDSRKCRTTALLLLSVGLLLLSCGIAWQHAFAHLLHLQTAHDDFYHGFCIGLGLAMETGALVMLVRSGMKRQKG